MCTPLVDSQHTTDQHAPDAVTAAIEANLADYWLALGKNSKGMIHESDSLSWEYSGGPYLNRVVGTQLGLGDADDCIDDVIKTFRDRKAAITWLVGPSTRPADLGSRLIQHGFSRNEGWKGMARDLHDLDSLPEHPSGLDVVEVNNERSRRDWIDVIARSYQLPRAARSSLYDSLTQEYETESSVWHHYLAYLDGEPVAAATLFVSTGTAGIYLVATVQEARNRGLGTAITAHVLRQAHDMNCTLAVLQSAGTAHTIYERLGFKYYCDIEVYRLPAPRPLWKRIAAMLVRLPTRRNRKGRASRESLESLEDRSKEACCEDPEDGLRAAIGPGQ